MKKILSAIALILVSAICGYSQQEYYAPFTADRPGASTGPATVGLNVFQIEQGFGYNRSEGLNTFTFSNTLLRFGLFKNAEIRLSADGLCSSETGINKWSAAFSGLTAGTKINCFEGRGAIPAISVLAELQIPGTASEGYGVEHLAPSLYLLFENFITDWLYICYNVGAQWDGTSPTPGLFLAASLGADISDKVGTYIESYNTFAPQGNNYAIDFGFYWSVARRLQLDISADLGLNNTRQNWGISLGFAWQLNK